MSTKRSLYFVPRMLDEGIRVVGLTLDEFIPAALLGGFLFFSGSQIIAVITATVAVILMKVLKRGRGCSWLFNAFYWYLPKSFSSLVVGRTPPSKYREYIA